MVAGDMAATHAKSGASRGLAAIVLAAGRSTRMKSSMSKVLHEVCGRPMLAYVLAACREAGIERICVVVGFGKEAVIDRFGNDPGIVFVEQAEQKGTGHAVRMCASQFADFTGDCVVIAGDMPLIHSETLRELVSGHRAAAAQASLATTVLADPTSYGRIIRGADGAFEAIVEHRDCTQKQLEITEVNPSYYCFDAAALFDALEKITPNNAKGEYYVTDVFRLLRQAGKRVLASVRLSAEDATGINSREDLALVNKLMQRRICRRWMDQGVTIIDPENTWIDGRATIGAETVLLPFCMIEGNARIGVNCRVGPFSHVQAGAVLADGATLGPGVLTALDAARPPRTVAQPAGKRTVQVVRRPPTQSGCA